MSEKTGEDILESGLLEVHNEIQPASAAFDPTVLVGIITGIMSLIQSCKESSAARQIKRGKAISKRAIREVLVAENYQGDVREAAKRLAEKGRALTEDDIKAIIDDANDVPPSNSWWPGLVVLLLLLVPLSANANEEIRYWPMVEQAKATTAEAWWPEPIKPRRARILFFKTNGCVSCLEDEALLFPQLREAGYKIGESPDSHIQIINVDKHPEYRQKFRPVGYPSYVAVLDERETARWTGRIQRNRLIQMQHNVVARQNGNFQQQQARR